MQAHLDMAIYNAIHLQSDHAVLLIPQSTTQFPKFCHINPPLPPLAQVSVHLVPETYSLVNSCRALATWFR